MTIFRLLKRGFRLVRLEQWWAYKLLPPVMVFYATCLISQRSLTAHLTDLISLVAALAAGAAGVSLLNDWFDKADDAKAGKANRVTGLSLVRTRILAIASLVISAWFLVLWSDETLVLAVYLACWISFLLYSVPPIRLKQRGALGVVADAAGSSLFPCLLALLLVAGSELTNELNYWVLSIALWSLMFGVRGIAWHQIADVNNDLASRTTTWVVRLSPERVARIVRMWIAPLEIAAILAVFYVLGTQLTVTVLVIYGCFVAFKILRFHSYPSLSKNQKKTYFLFHELYLILLPFAFLIELAQQGLAPWWVLGMQFVAFTPLHSTFLSEWSRLFVYKSQREG